MKQRALAMGLLAAAVLASGCARSPSDGAGVMATTTIVGDLVGNVAIPCGRDVETLMDIGQDPHSFQASASQAARVRSADLVVANGLGLEEGLGSVLDAARVDGVTVVTIGDWADPIEIGVAENGALDPHVWLDPRRMAEVASRVGAALGAADPAKADCYAAAADAYRTEIMAVDESTGDLIERVPPANRVLVTSHASLAYFAERYGFESLGTIVPGGSALAEPSAGDLVDLIEAMRGSGTDVIFTETTRPQRLAAAVSREIGYDVAVVELFTGSLGAPGSGAESYLTMMRTNAQLISEALRS